MHRIVRLLLLMLYLPCNMLLQAEVHYCGNSISDISFFSSSSAEDCNCGTKSRKCCHSEQVNLDQGQQQIQENLPYFYFQAPGEMPALSNFSTTINPGKEPRHLICLGYPPFQRPGLPVFLGCLLI